MFLKDWVAREGKKQEDLAEELGCDQGHVSRLIAGKAVGSPATIQRIAEVTGGAVTFDDMVRANSEAAKAA